MSESMPNTPNTSGTTQFGTLGTSPSFEIASPSNEAKIFESKAQGSVTTSSDENPEQQPYLEQGINAPEPTLPRLPPTELQGGDGTGSRESRSEIPDSDDFLSSSPVRSSVEGVVNNEPASMRCHDGGEDVLVQGSGVVISSEQDNGKNSVSTCIQPTESEISMTEEKTVDSSGDVGSGMVGEDDGLGVLHTGLGSVLDNAESTESCVGKDSNSKHEESAFSASADAPEVTNGTNSEAENEIEDLGEECAAKDAGHEADNGEDTNTILGVSLDKESGNQLSKTLSKSSRKMVLEALPPEPEFEPHTSGSATATKDKNTTPIKTTVVQDEDIQMSDTLASSAIVEENNELAAPINNNCSKFHNAPIQSEREEIGLRTTESPNPSFNEAATESNDTEMMEAPPSSAELNDDQSVQAKNSDPIDPPSSLPESDTNSITTLGEARAPSTAPSEQQTGDKQMSEVSFPSSEAKNSATAVSKVPKQKAKASTSQSSSQNQDILLAELKAIKIANIQARTAALKAEIEAKRAKLAEVTKDLKNPAAETVKRHIKLLHDYNDIRDVGQGLVGMIADNRGVRIGEIYGEFGVGVKD